MGSSSGLILADQTGIGKGRTVASIIRWAVLQGKVAIFITQKETLFVDMVRDLRAIGFDKHPIFVVNTNVVKVDGKDFSSNKLKEKYSNEKIIFTTYSQIQRETKNSWKQEFIKKISKGAILVLDEAHEAASSVGAINDNPNTFPSKDKESNRYKFISSLYSNIDGVLFSSATYAKRPDNLMLYYPFTDLNNFSYNKLLQMLKDTGSIGQALVSNALVESGQLIRRESSYQGIIFNDFTTPDLVKLMYNDKSKEDEELQFVASTWDKIAYILKDIVEFERNYKPLIMREINEDLKSKGKSGLGGENTMKADSSNFTAVMHNTIKQLDLALKAKTIADYAVNLVKSGQKVLIYLHYTNKSFFTENFRLGDKVEDNISLVLRRNWNRILEYSIKDKPGFGSTSTKYTITMSQLDMIDGARDFYLNIGKKIDKLNVEVPLSALDYFHYTLNKKEIKTLEITGRTEYVNYAKGKVLTARKGKDTSDEKLAKLATDEVSRLFNNTSDHNVIIFNSSGSTGISLHASKDFKNQKKRHMIIAQPSDDINTYMQAFGRINRTGQTVLPEYTFVSLPIPVSNRIRIVLRKKLDSLNANVKGSSKDENMKDIIDMANEHGDEVTFRHLMQAYGLEPDNEIRKLNEMLADPCNLLNKEKTSSYNAFLRVTGRLPVLSIREQENFYDQITDKFLGHMEDMKRAGVSLEETALDLEAKTIETKQLLAKSGNNIFQQACNLEIVEIKTEHPDLHDIYDNLDFDKGFTIKEEFEKEIDKYITEKEQQAKLTNTTFNLTNNQISTKKDFYTYLDRFRVGSIHEWQDNTTKSGERKFELMFVKDIRFVPRKNTFPASLSYLKVDFVSAANLTGEVFQTLILSQKNFLTNITARNIPKNEIKKYLEYMQNHIDNLNNKREIITGNLIHGLTLFGNQGKYTTYTTNDGKIKTGILIKANRKTEITEYSEKDLVHKIINLKQKLTFGQVDIYSRNIIDEDGEESKEPFLFIEVPRSKKTGGKFYLDKNLINLTVKKQGFISKNENSNFVGKFKIDQVNLVLQELKELGIVFEVIDVKDSK
jgi:hypothetical protein